MAKQNQLLEEILAALHRLRSHLEVRTIIPLTEGVMRFWYHLNPRVYSERMRIKRVTKGRLEKKSDRFVIFVLFANSPLPQFTKNLFDVVTPSRLNLIIVSNNELDDAFRASLVENCHLLIERVNLGRDFGGYKDGISLVRAMYPNIERLILINDSLFFFEKGLSKVIAALDGDQDFIGLTEVFEFHYHVQSFMLSFGPRVLNHKRFMKYWKHYRPISTRRWSIHRGEVGFTRCLTKVGFKPHILYHGSQILPHLCGKPIREILLSVRLLPTFFRRQLYNVFEGIIEDNNKGPVATIESIAKVLQNFSGTATGDQQLSAIRNTNINQLAQLSEQNDTISSWSRDVFVHQVVSTITTRNQVHVGGFLFMKHLGMPVLKRDVFYREVYALEDIYEILTEFGEPLRDEVIADLRRSGTAATLTGFAKILYRHGSI